MVRIKGIDLNDKHRVDYALTHIKGIGWSRAFKILESVKVNPSIRIGKLTTKQVTKITAEVDKFETEGDLIRVVQGNVSRMQAIGSYKGMRHSKGLPVRGQRTRSNARTKKGKRKTVGSFRKDELTKMQQSPAKSK